MVKRGKGVVTQVKRGLKNSTKKVEKANRGKQLLLKGKKKRNADPGIRHQGGRIYDSENGTTCHQCRQKTIEIKAQCKSARCGLQFCPRCLLNRYNEVVEKVIKYKVWKCPKCRQVCNCSFCRKKQGLEATGILADIAKSAGFGSVSQLLEKNPHIKRSRDDAGKGNNKQNENSFDRQRKRSLPLPTARGRQDFVGIDDCKLKRRKQSMPVPIDLKIHSIEDGSFDVPKGIDDTKLVCILEFFSTFGSTIEIDNICLPSIAKSLLCKQTTSQKRDLVIKDALSKLKVIICNWFGDCDPEELSWDDWVVDRYTRKCRVGSNAEASSEIQSKRRSERSCVKKQKTFWSLDSAQRIDVVYSMIHEALECGPIVDVIEQNVHKGDLSEPQKIEIERIKKEIKAEQEKHKQRFIAELISSHQVNNLSAEKQQEIIHKARSDSTAAISEENKARLRWLSSSEYLKTHPSARRVALGQDRDGTYYYSLSCAQTITGSSSGIVCISESKNTQTYFDDINGLQDALDVSGEKEGILAMALKEVENTLRM